MLVVVGTDGGTKARLVTPTSCVRGHSSPPTLRTCPFSVMLVYMALLGRSLCGGSSISISLLCLYLSGRDGELTADTHEETLPQKHIYAVRLQQMHGKPVEMRFQVAGGWFLSCLPLMVEGAECIICEGAEWVELRLEEEGLACSL